MTLNCACRGCTAKVSPEDAVYDERMQLYFCSTDCFRDWADENFEVITDYYEQMNVT